MDIHFRMGNTGTQILSVCRLCTVQVHYVQPLLIYTNGTGPLRRKAGKERDLLKAIQPYKLADGKSIEYGYGFFIKTENGIHSIGHGGAIDGFRAIAMYYPDQDIFISLLINSETEDFERFFSGYFKYCIIRQTRQ